MVIFLSKLNDEYTLVLCGNQYYYRDMKTIGGYRPRKRIGYRN